MKQNSMIRQTWSSLANRVLFTTIAIVGFPLLIHTLFLYKREYHENVKNVFITIRTLAEARTLYLEQMIQYQKTLLQTWMDDLPKTVEERDHFIRLETKEHKISHLFYVTIDPNGKASCLDPLCPEPVIQSFLVHPQNDGSFLFIHPVKEDNWLYIGKFETHNDQIVGALIIATPIDVILNQLAYRAYTPYPLKVSLVNESGKIFISSEEGIAGKQFAQSSESFHWTIEKGLSNAWRIDTKKGRFLSTKIPIPETNYLLMLDVPENEISSLQIKNYLYRVTSLLFLIGLFGGGILIWLTRRMSRPLQSLCNVMERTSQGATHVRFTKDPLGFEINVLGEQTNQMISAMFNYHQEAEQEKIIRERLAEELRIGRRIQASMLPHSFPNIPSLEIAPGYLAAHEVSGDFYELFALSDGRILMAVADAADKGISACLYSLSFRSMLRTSAVILHELSSVVAMANDLLIQDTLESNFFITAWIGIYDPKTDLLDYCSQGHPPAYLQKADGSLTELTTHGIALGVENISPVIKQVSLEEGDLLLLYTDGVIEAFNSDHKLFGKERLKKSLDQLTTTPPQTVVDHIINEVRTFTKNTTQSDDLTLLAIRIKNKK